MRQLTFYCIGAALLALCPAATARTFTFDTAPFAGTNVLNTPGRQLVGGEDFLPFLIPNDIFSMDAAVFGVEPAVHFVDSTAANLPSGGVCWLSNVPSSGQAGERRGDLGRSR